MSIAAPYRRQGRLEGTCLCGAVTLRVDGGYVAAVGACHCGLCQKAFGTLFAAFEVDAEALEVTGAVQAYASTPFSERVFCPTCGSNLWLRDTDDAAAPYEVMPGLFPAAAAFPLISEIYVDRRPAYLPLGGDHAMKTRADYEAVNRHVEGSAQ